jgi:hypothetical protein
VSATTRAFRIELLAVKHRRVLFCGLTLLAAFLTSCQSRPTLQPATHEPASAQQPVAAAPAVAPSVSPPVSAPVPKEEVAAVRVHADGQLGPGKNVLFIDIAAPEGAKLTLESPLSVRGSGGIGLDFPNRLNGPLSSHPMPLRLPIEVADGATGPARLELTYYWCTDGNEAACIREQAHLDVELDLSGSAAGGEAHLTYRARGRS